MRRRTVLPPVLLSLGLVAVLNGAPYWPQLWLFDLYQRIAPSHRDISRITIIDVDSDSVRRIGQWPWPRDRLADLVAKAHGALAIGIDILLLDPDRTLNGAPDLQLAHAIAQAPVVLAATRDEVARTEVISVTPIVQSGSEAQAFVPSISQVAWPLASIGRAASGTGLALILPERDGVVRRLPTLFANGATLLPSFALDVLRVAGGETLLRVRSSAGGVQAVSVDRMTVATDPNGSVWPHFAKETPARTISAYRVLAGQVDPALLDGRIVLIGSSLAGLGDVHLTPLQVTETGTAINAQLIGSILARDTLWRPSAAGGGEALLLAGLGVASVMLFGRISWWMQAALVGGIGLILAASSFGAFAASGMLLDWTLPTAGMVVVNFGLGAIRLLDVRRARRKAETDLAKALDEIQGARSLVTRALASTKLATIGEMASVLAHELRQPIATMSMAAENAEAALQDGRVDVSDARLRIDRIMMQAKRAESMIDHLGVFARAEAAPPAPVDLEAAVCNALLLVEPFLRRDGVGVDIRCEPGLPAVDAVAVMIEQVVINLCINARDAMAEGSPNGRAVALSMTSAGNRVTLEVADTGPGISVAAIERLFEPFFTTKPAGSGTGLGLSVCRKIVESFGGSITARNGAERGAVFVVTLPAVAEISPGT